MKNVLLLCLNHGTGIWYDFDVYFEGDFVSTFAYSAVGRQYIYSGLCRWGRYS